MATSEIERQAGTLRAVAETLAPSSRHDPEAWALLAGIIRSSHLAPIELEIRKLSEQHFTFDDILLDGQPVTPYSRPRYLYQEDDPQKRHIILTRVAEGHPEVDQAIRRHHAKQRELGAKWGYTPLDRFLEVEGVTLTELRRLLVDLATAIEPAFKKRFAENRQAVLGGNQGEPWEDLVTLFMNRWSAHADHFIPKLDAVAAGSNAARLMGFPVEDISMDLDDRPKKVPGASAWRVRAPADVRICVKPVGGAEDLSAIYHEMGHALHFVSIDPALVYWIRDGVTAGVAETFSFWMQTLVSDPLCLTDLELKETAAAELIRFEHLARATFATWLSLQALCVIDYWTAGPVDLEELGESLSGYMRQCMSLSVPAGAIRVMPTFLRTLNFNTVGYPVAYARLGHLLAQLEANRRDWWHSPAAVGVVRGYMRGGAQAGFPAAMLDTNPFTKRYANSLF